MSALEELLSELREVCAGLEDKRLGQGYRCTMADIGLAAFSVFFMQSPSFLGHQRALTEGHGQSNCQTLLGMACIGLDLIGQLSDLGVRLRVLTGLLSRRLRWLGSADRSTFPWPLAGCQGRSASAFCHSPIALDGCGPRCTGAATGRGRPAVRPGCDRACRCASPDGHLRNATR
jgi:hypothetical protein